MFRNLLRFSLTSKHLETKLNYQKHIKFNEIYQKKIFFFLLLFCELLLTILGPTTRPQLESFSHLYHVILWTKELYFSKTPVHWTF